MTFEDVAPDAPSNPSGASRLPDPPSRLPEPASLPLPQVDVPEEKARLEAKGGYVRPEAVDDEGEVIPSRLYTHEGGNQPGLRISRMLGDLAVRHLVTCEPEVHQHTVDSSDEFLIMASDGM